MLLLFSLCSHRREQRGSLHKTCLRYQPGRKHTGEAGHLAQSGIGRTGLPGVAGWDRGREERRAWDRDLPDTDPSTRYAFLSELLLACLHWQDCLLTHFLTLHYHAADHLHCRPATCACNVWYHRGVVRLSLRLRAVTLRLYMSLEQSSDILPGLCMRQNQ